MERMNFPLNMEKKTREYAFNKKEKSRLQLIQIVKNRRKAILMQQAQSNNKQQSNQRIKSYSDIDRDRNDKGQLYVLRNELESEMTKTRYFKNWIIDCDLTEAKRKEMECLDSIHSRKNSLDKFRLQQIEKRKEMKEDKIKRKEIIRKILLEGKQDEQRRSQEIEYENIKRNRIMESNQRTIKILERAKTLRELEHIKFERKYSILSEKLDRIKLMQDKGMKPEKRLNLKDYTSIVKQNKDNLMRKNEQMRAIIYFELCRKLDANQSRTASQKLKRSMTIRKSLELKSEKSKQLRQVLHRKSLHNIKTIMKREKSNKIKVLKAKEVNVKNIKIKKCMSQINVDIVKENKERINKKDIFINTQLKEDVDKKMEKVDEFYKARDKAIIQNRQEHIKSENKRERVRQALNYMAIWNAWNSDIIEHLIKRDNSNYASSGLMTEILRGKNEGLTKLESEIPYR